MVRNNPCIGTTKKGQLVGPLEKKVKKNEEALVLRGELSNFLNMKILIPPDFQERKVITFTIKISAKEVTLDS